MSSSNTRPPPSRHPLPSDSSRWREEPVSHLGGVYPAGSPAGFSSILADLAAAPIPSSREALFLSEKSLCIRNVFSSRLSFRGLGLDALPAAWTQHIPRGRAMCGVASHAVPLLLLSLPPSPSVSRASRAVFADKGMRCHPGQSAVRAAPPAVITARNDKCFGRRTERLPVYWSLRC